MIYLDHAATTPVKDEVLAAMLPYFSVAYANPSASYRTARTAKQAIDHARQEIADALGAKRSEICFTSGGTEADNWALFGLAAARPDKRHIITTPVEHHAVLHACEALSRKGYEITYLPVDEHALVSVEALDKALRPDTLMVSVMLANNEIGTIEPLSRIVSIAHEHGVPVHTDAVQAAGHIPVDVNDLGVDLLSISAHKFGGPKGIGALYIRDGLHLEPLICGGAQERGLRSGTENVPAIVGMGKALSLACAHMPDASAYVGRLRHQLKLLLEEIPGVHIHGNFDCILPGHLHISIDHANSQLLLMRLDMEGIAVSSGSACASGAAVRSHVMEAIHPDENQADLRFSIGESNTIEEITTAAAVLRRILKR